MRMSRFNAGWRSSTSDVVADRIDDRHASGHCAAPGGPAYAPTHRDRQHLRRPSDRPGRRVPAHTAPCGPRHPSPGVRLPRHARRVPRDRAHAQALRRPWRLSGYVRPRGPRVRMDRRLGRPPHWHGYRVLRRRRPRAPPAPDHLRPGCPRHLPRPVRVAARAQGVGGRHRPGARPYVRRHRVPGQPPVGRRAAGRVHRRAGLQRRDRRVAPDPDAGRLPDHARVLGQALQPAVVCLPR
jgi:hypothetical protein